MINYEHFYLRVVKETLSLPAGIVCFCIRDQDGEFWVSTSQVYNGVLQFGFGDEHRDHFEIYGANGR